MVEEHARYETQCAKLPSNSEEEAQFVDDPVRSMCPHCDRWVVSEVEHNHNKCSAIVLPIVLFLLTHICGICIYPLVVGYFKDAVHTCPRCGMTIKRVSRFKRPRVSQEIITLQCGNCAVVFSKGYVIIFGVVLLMIGGVSYMRWHLRTYGLPDIQEGPDIPATWESFYSDCASRSSLSNPLHRHRQFVDAYQGKSVSWLGRLNSVQPLMWGKGAVAINMDPHMPIDPRKADLSLIFNEHKLTDALSEISQGDEISFRATLVDLGSRREPVIGYLWDVNMTRPNSELPDMFAQGASDKYMVLPRPPIAHLPQLAKRVAEARNEFVHSRLQNSQDANRGFYLGDDIVGAPPYIKASNKQEDQ